MRIVVFIIISFCLIDLAEHKLFAFQKNNKNNSSAQQISFNLSDSAVSSIANKIKIEIAGQNLTIEQYQKEQIEFIESYFIPAALINIAFSMAVLFFLYKLQTKGLQEENRGNDKTILNLSLKIDELNRNINTLHKITNNSISQVDQMHSKIDKVILSNEAIVISKNSIPVLNERNTDKPKDIGIINIESFPGDISGKKIRKNNDAEYFYIKNDVGVWKLYVKEYILSKHPDEFLEKILSQYFLVERENDPPTKYEFISPAELDWNEKENSGNIKQKGMISEK